MNAYAYKKIDAFASGKSTGNPAACLFLRPGETLDQDAMLDIARQHRGFVSEVVYCSGGGDVPFELCYFSSEGEVDFCGHGTIACMYSLIRNSPALLRQKVIAFQTRKKGQLTLFNEIPGQDAVFITAPEAEHLETDVSRDEVAKQLSLPAGQISPDRPIDLINAGLRTLIVPIGRLRDEIAVFPNEARLRSFCEARGVDIVLIYSLETANADYAAHTRVFAPRFGYLEDPATGSGNSAFGNYLLKNGLWSGETIAIEQGGVDRVFNTVKLSLRDGRVLFGGGALDRIAGSYYYG